MFDRIEKLFDEIFDKDFKKFLDFPDKEKQGYVKNYTQEIAVLWKYPIEVKGYQEKGTPVNIPDQVVDGYYSWTHRVSTKVPITSLEDVKEYITPDIKDAVPVKFTIKDIKLIFVKEPTV
jgi:hypothetical protein